MTVPVLSLLGSRGSVSMFSVFLKSEAEAGIWGAVEVWLVMGAVPKLSNRLPTIVVSGVKGSRKRNTVGEN